MPQYSWSVNTSLASMLKGELVDRRELYLDEQRLVADWKVDERTKIILWNLHKMSSVLNAALY